MLKPKSKQRTQNLTASTGKFFIEWNMCFACFALGHYKREKINFKIDKEGHERVLLV